MIYFFSTDLFNITTNSDGVHMKNFSINIWLNGSTNDALEIDFDDGIVKNYYPSIDGKYLF